MTLSSTKLKIIKKNKKMREIFKSLKVVGLREQ